MRNLVGNPHLSPGTGGTPRFFSINGDITYDQCCICGYRTLSLTSNNGLSSRVTHDQPIYVYGRRTLSWGFIIRSMYADSIVLHADFYDMCGNLLCSRQRDITYRVHFQFSRQQACFHIPTSANTVILSLQLNGCTTAATFFNPLAYTR